MFFKNGIYTTSDLNEIECLDSLAYNPKINKMKTYILQKNTPFCKAGANFAFVEETDMYHQNGDKYLHSCPTDEVECNPEWFILKEDVNPTVLGVEQRENAILFSIYKFGTVAVLRERLAEILIAESNCELFIDNPKDRTESGKRYTEKELLEAEEKAFNAAKLHVSIPICNIKGVEIKNILTEH